MIGATPPAEPLKSEYGVSAPGADRELFETLGDGLVVVYRLRDARLTEDAARPAGSRRAQHSVGSWLHLGSDGIVQVYTGKVEVGQNIRTSLSQIVAEELRVPLESIRLVMGDTAISPFDLGTFSSLTIRLVGAQLRSVAAAARQQVLDVAARLWGVDVVSLTLADGRVAHEATRRTMNLGEVVGGVRFLSSVSGEETPTSPEDWTIAGAAVGKVDGLAYVTGRHRYASDLTLPGMVVGKVVRPPAFGATLEWVDTHQAETLPGVRVVQDGVLIGVTAPDEPAAARALAAVKTGWRTVPQQYETDLFEYLRHNTVEMKGRGGTFRQTDGSLEEGWATADGTLKQTYTVDFIAHAPMEPRAAVAQWKDGALTVWTATQRPFAVRSELAAALTIPEHTVRVIVPDTGCAFGGKHTGDAAIEAARLARAVDTPVRVVWTREEEFTWAYFRPAGAIEVSSGFRYDRTLTAWDFRVYNAGSDGILTPYRVPNRHIEFHPARSPLRQGAYRGLAATANHFAREVHVDELAHILGADPLEFRSINLVDPRLTAVLMAASGVFGWSTVARSPGRGFGIACGTEKGSYVATCAEVAVDPATDEVTIVRIVEAFECGAIVNPRHLRGQVQGAIIQGLGGALFESVQFEDGRILNAAFSRYRVPRFGDVPLIDVVLCDRRDLPSVGAGETPIVCVAPALCNAIFDATRKRLRALPLTPEGLRA